MKSRAYKSLTNQELSGLLFFSNNSDKGLTGRQIFDILVILS